MVCAHNWFYCFPCFTLITVQINTKCSPNELVSVYESQEINNNLLEGVDV